MYLYILFLNPVSSLNDEGGSDDVDLNTEHCKKIVVLIFLMAVYVKI